MEEEVQAKTADACIPSAPTLDALILQTTPADNDNAVDKALQQDIGQSVAISLRTELILYYVRLVAFVAVVLVCLTWTACLLLLTVATNDTMNRVMDTAQLDYESFWLVVDPPLAVVGMGVAGLSIVGLGYLAIPVLMYRQSKLPLPHKITSSRTQSRSISSLTKSARLESLRAHLEQGAKTRQKLSVAIKLGDLFIQFVFLVQVLNAGMAVSLVSFFASIVALNAFTTALWMFLPLKNIGVVHVLLDTGFDFLIAIIFPMAVVLHSIRSFHFDRPLMAIANQVFRDGAFERVALMVVDPMEFNVIRRNFDWLRIRSVLDIFTRVGVNLGLCVNFMSLAKLIILSRTKKLSRPNVYPRNRLIGVLFGLFAIAVTVFAGESVRTSMNACAPHPECVQNAHLWIGPSGSCPCITLVDRERYVRSFDEWTNPLDVSDKVNQLAAAGKLQTLQIVNRALHTLPENLRHCKNLRRLDLTYTDTTLLPEWTKEFTKLEYLHIEGKADNSSLASFPSEVFSKMDTLAFLHLGQLLVHQLPSLDSLRRLQVFNVVLLIELLQLPSFDKLVNLKRITLGYLLPVQTVPRLDFIPNLQSLNSIDRGTFCCNGFLGGSCNLVHPMCKTHPNFGTPPATCLSADQVATPKTLAYFKKFNSSVCGGGVLAGGRPWRPSEDRVRQCNGTMYRKCSIPKFEATSICLNKRWMAISCYSDALSITARRLQIAKGLGLPCDPLHEAWLGCNATRAS